ncbi:hypothetical protein PR202_gb07063 [Eleusine coracana subsp. coracana]|uniref:Katanin p80 WD40 repeat-containing subunit B1 homolog n=1 Tax=Eleusine coracana subsp. coracana TaxID=191504 RepID=A0AAV5E8R7_ELECO|nr:hypothetical protein PR202_gb07063 [Eleusine coracana subsp. coracana]
MLITGGEDMKVNLWAVGKPSAFLSLTGLTSPVESVGFDSSEVTIGAGAASGTIKIWDVEEAKVIRTFTGHRSNCASLDFHPFGEFLASGSSDTNMKIWDIRKKRCIHTYKGHSRRVDVLKFTPDGRWIVSGGADNSVKIWDLTAGKLLHDFNLHRGPVNCLDFHPHEFLLATGSADKTVKFWDLETFELIGSSGPENSREYYVPANVVRSMKFNSDGKTLFCGLHERLKVLSWEPIVCHDVVDVGWSTLADLTVDEGKLLGCSYNQNCIGVWVVNLMRTEPYAVGSAESHLTGSINRPVRADSSISSVFDRLSISKNPANEIAPNTQLKRSMSASKEILVSASSTLTKRLSKEPRTIDLQLTRSDFVPLLFPGVRLDPHSLDDNKRQQAAVEPLPVPKFSSKVDLSSNAAVLSHHSLVSATPTYKSRPCICANSNEASSFIPVFVPRHSSKVDASPIISEPATGDLRMIEPENLAVNHGKEDGMLVKLIDSRNSNKDVEASFRRITDNVECNKTIPETSSKANLGFDFRMRASKSQNVCERIFQSKPISAQRKNIRETSGHGEDNFSMSACTESVNSNETGSWYDVSGFEKRNSAARRTEFADTNRSAVIRLSKLMESSGRHGELRPSSSNFDKIQYESTLDGSRWQASFAGRQNKSTIDEDAMAALMENHQKFIHIGAVPFMLPGAEENECQPHVADKVARRGWEIGTGAEPLS